VLAPGPGFGSRPRHVCLEIWREPLVKYLHSINISANTEKEHISFPAYGGINYFISANGGKKELR
jgi:hypothetical protein